MQYVQKHDEIIFKNVIITIEKFYSLLYNYIIEFTKHERGGFMNIAEMDILNTLVGEPYINQRILSQNCGHSLGIVNRSLKNLIENEYLTEDISLTKKAKTEIKTHSPKNAIVLAAGFGMRMVPINTETSKAFLEIGGEPLIERIIKQLHEVGITDIYVIVGFMKEQFEYLIDDFGVKIIVNPKYSAKNNLHSLKLTADVLGESYIIPCDVWCGSNPFSKTELYSWYMVSDLVDNDSSVRVNRKGELTVISEKNGGNQMIGIAYLCGDKTHTVKQRLAELTNDNRYDDAFWEETLYDKDRMIVNARVVHSDNVIEINTYEQLRELDGDSNQLKTDKLEIIGKVLNVSQEEITNIEVLKKGMTNRSFLFSAKGKKYIMRIPGEGTDLLINRKEEAKVCKIIKDTDICEDIVFIDPHSGYKITRFIDNAFTCDPFNSEQTKKCMSMLRKFHQMNLQAEHTFDIFAHIDFYQSLWNGKSSAYRDYEKTKENVFKLKPFIDKHACPYVLSHIDAVPDNFLFSVNEKGEEEIHLIDWEYAAMQDPHVDIAMFCIYSMYERKDVDRLINEYFTEGCSDKVRIKIYCYIAACGLLWSNWCEYKRQLGVEFGEYSLRQYRFAKDYCKIAIEEMKKLDDDKNV